MNQVVRVGVPSKDSDESEPKIFYRCLFSCNWKWDETFTYQNVIYHIKDMIPVGFDGTTPILDRPTYHRVYKAHCENVMRHPELNCQETPEFLAEQAVIILNDELLALNHGTASASNLARINLLLANGRCNSYGEANAYLMDNRLIELEVADSSATANASNANAPIEIDD
jgi:hypothetical protein